MSSIVYSPSPNTCYHRQQDQTKPMSLVEILPSARKLSSIEKLQLIRILAEEVELGTDSLGKNSSEEETEFW